MIRDRLIKLLGGYTETEYLRVERKYQGLLDSKSSDVTIRVSNENLYRALQTLVQYAKKDLYGTNGSEWSRRMYNVLNNNYIRIVARYISTGCPFLYSIDTTLEKDKEFENILKFEESITNSSET